MAASRVISLATTLLATVSGAALPRPHIWITAADIPRLRAMAAEQTADAFGNIPAEAWAKLRDQADRFLKAEPYSYAVDIPGREGAPATKWSYTLGDEKPPHHDDSKHYPPWTAMFQERADSISTRLRLLTFAYVTTGDAAYADRAKQIVLHLCAWEGVWTDPSYGGGKPCLDTGHAAVWVSVFYDWCHDRLSDAERATVRQALVAKALAPIDGYIDSVSPYHNFTAVIANGLAFGAVALLGEDERAAGWLDHATARMRLNMDAQGEDGGALEGPMYGTYAANQLADMLWLLGGIGRASELSNHQYLASLPRYCIALLDPGTKQQPCFGDGGPGAGFVNLSRVLALQGSGDAAWYCREVGGLALGSVRQFLSVDPARIRPGKPPASPSGCYRAVGYATLRDAYNPEAAFLAFKCGPPEAKVGHNHYDHGSFMLSYNGEWIGWDPGYRNYFDPPKRRYTAGTIGHSSVILDLDDDYLASMQVTTPGRDQIHLNRAALREFHTSAAADYVRGEIAPAYNPEEGEPVLNRFDREVLFLKPRVFVLRDDLRAPAAHAYSVMLHGPAGSDFAIAGDRATLAGTRASLDAWFFGPAGPALRTALFPQAESYGPYLAATFPAAAEAELLTVLVPRRELGTVANPGFEKGMRGWQPRRLPQVVANHVIDEEVSHSGKASGRIDNSGYYYSPRTNVTPGTRLTARWWAKCTAPGADSILYYWRGGKSFARAAGPAAEGDEWRQYEFSDTVPEGTEQFCLALQFNGKGQCWYDDVEILSDEKREASPPAVVRQVAPGVLEITVDGQHHLVLSGGLQEQRTVRHEGHEYSLRGRLGWVRLGEGEPVGFAAPGGTLLRDGTPVPVAP